MYLGAKSVSRLKAFIDGYRIAIESSKQPMNQESYFGFFDWVSREYKIETSHSWDNIALFMSGGDEHAALDLTRELWKRYKDKINQINN